ncbi:MAG: zinc ribbon domain-containing protein [Alloprevotella sp.]|nr:zinc ribbon domain-containing protein [Prevotellamassilia sp.]MDY5761645.1 zinc ribbon domain-containing protein [Alloprevotella sp.]
MQNNPRHIQSNGKWFVQRLTCLCLLVVGLLTACQAPVESDAWSSDNPLAVDSVEFIKSRHYWKGYNFETTDTFKVQQLNPVFLSSFRWSDTLLTVSSGEQLVVSDIVRITTQQDSAIWVKLTAISANSVTAWRDTTKRPASMAKPQPVTGWIKESVFIKKVVPDRPVSKLIYTMGKTSFRLVMAILALLTFATLLWLRRINHRPPLCVKGGYPMLLSMVFGLCVIFHRSIWLFVPGDWVAYYFNPTLNPLKSELPLIVALFLASFWMLIVVGLATLEDQLRSAPSFGKAVHALLYLMGQNLVVFGVLAILLPYYFAVAAYVLYALWLFKRYRRQRHSHPLYRCGACGAALERLGTCPHCGAVNH